MKLHALQNDQQDSSSQKTRMHLLSHELRTPLAIISGYAQVLKEEIAGSEKDFVEPIIDSVGRLERVITTLLEWEESGLDSEMETSNCDVRDIVSSVVDSHNALALSKSIDVVIIAKETRIAAYSSAESIRSAVSKLVHNAIKFSDAGQVRIHIDASPSHITVRVEDDGPGISGNATRLFEPFVQGTSGLDRPFEGLGLGLSLVQKEASRLNGKISLSNGPEKGAVAELFFPRFAVANRKSNTTRKAA